VGDKSKQMYLIVITDAKADVPDLTLEKHHDMTRDRTWQKMKNTSATEPIPLTIDGHPALQDELTGTEKGTNVVFLHTTVDDGDHFQQILAWTLKRRWQKQNELLREITRTFHSEKWNHLGLRAHSNGTSPEPQHFAAQSAGFSSCIYTVTQSLCSHDEKHHSLC